MTFTRPTLGLFEFEGSKDNTIVFDGTSFAEEGVDDLEFHKRLKR